MKRDHVYTVAIMIFIVVGLISTLSWSFNKQAKIEYDKTAKVSAMCDSLIRERDSLGAEIFTLKIQLGRYEYIIDRAEDEMSKECKNQLDEIIKNTE
jgi:hypothetical protein